MLYDGMCWDGKIDINSRGIMHTELMLRYVVVTNKRQGLKAHLVAARYYDAFPEIM
jgi:hypothetical protein